MRNWSVRSCDCVHAWCSPLCSTSLKTKCLCVVSIMPWHGTCNIPRLPEAEPSPRAWMMQCSFIISCIISQLLSWEGTPIHRKNDNYIPHRMPFQVCCQFTWIWPEWCRSFTKFFLWECNTSDIFIHKIVIDNNIINNLKILSWLYTVPRYCTRNSTTIKSWIWNFRLVSLQLVL